MKNFENIGIGKDLKPIGEKHGRNDAKVVQTARGEKKKGVEFIKKTARNFVIALSALASGGITAAMIDNELEEHIMEDLKKSGKYETRNELVEAYAEFKSNMIKTSERVDKDGFRVITIEFKVNDTVESEDDDYVASK